jgi:uncharacterized protein (TIGR01777 family)
MNDNRIVIAGGSGFLGKSIARTLTQKHYEVVILSRSPEKLSKGMKGVYWDGKNLGPWANEIEGAKAVINLTGKNVICRYTPENINEIDSSRVDSVRVIDEAIGKCSKPPKAFVQVASLAIYGDRQDTILDESASAGRGTPVETCLKWERQFNSGNTPDTRRVLFRFGLALGKEAGVLLHFGRFARWFLGGQVGNGKQYMSWIHLNDLNGIIRLAIELDEIEGVFNACAPNPVTNKEFMCTLRNELKRPWSPPVPVLAVNIGSWLMGVEPSLALTGRRCIPKKLNEFGFQFTYPKLKGALKNIYEPSLSLDGIHPAVLMLRRSL